MNPDVFYWIGGVLAALAVVITFVGLRKTDFPASRGAMIGTIALFTVLVAASATYAVVNARDHQEHFREELAEYREAEGQEAEAEASEAADTGGEGSDAAAPTEAEEAAEEEGGPVSMVEYAFVPPEVQAERGDTVETTNDGQVVHNLTLREGSDELTTSGDIDPDGSGEVELDVEPGEYEMVCTVPGHEELGMVGTFTVE